MAAKKKYKLIVKIRKVTGSKWYNKGERHLVLPQIVKGFGCSGEPYFQKEKDLYGILCSDCTIIKHVEI